MASNLDDDPYITAKLLGLNVVLPKDGELFLDLNDTESRRQMHDMLNVSYRNGVVVEQLWESKSKSGNKHVALSFPKILSPIERIALQAIFGSDRTRELLSYFRIHKGLDRPPTVFFEVPE